MSRRIRPYSQEQSDNYDKVVSSSPSSNMTIYHLVPLDLQGTFFFKIVQLIMREIQDPMEVKRFKYALFMFLHVES